MKLGKRTALIINRRRSFAGAWIEIVVVGGVAVAVVCRSFAGAWIEIFVRVTLETRVVVAPSQERGLK